MNPKLYFKIEKGVLIPLTGQSKGLDKLFASNYCRKTNLKYYNDFTKNFILCNTGENGIFYSENYNYDSARNIFIFAELSPISQSDLEIIISGKFDSNFDFNKGYYITSEQSIENESNNVKKSIKNETIDLNKKISFIQNILNKFPKPSIQECGMHIDDSTWNYLIRNILRHQNTILIGPTGTGKTEIIMTIAKLLNLECNVYDMGGMQDPLTDLLGSHRLENGNSVFDFSAFSEKIQKPGIIILDELSRAPLMANNILFPCLDSRRELPVEIADSKSLRNIKVHPECVFIATANIGSEYSGTNDIDAALLNRFLPLRLNYLMPTNEISVLINKTNINKSQAEKIVKFANEIRQKYVENIISKSCSTRETLAIANLVYDGFSISDAFEYIILNKYNNPNDEEISIINKIKISL